MISEKMRDAINRQINEELFSAYLYQAMSAYFQAGGFAGFASWMNAQAQEEGIHAAKLYKHLVERGGRVKMLAIKEPQFEWASPLEAFEAAYGHEKYITGKINELVEISDGENDGEAKEMLQWFVKEQVEEEESADKNVQKVKAAGNDEAALKEADLELGKRKLIFQA